MANDFHLFFQSQIKGPRSVPSHSQRNHLSSGSGGAGSGLLCRMIQGVWGCLCSLHSYTAGLVVVRGSVCLDSPRGDHWAEDGILGIFMGVLSSA